MAITTPNVPIANRNSTPSTATKASPLSVVTKGTTLLKMDRGGSNCNSTHARAAAKKGRLEPNNDAQIRAFFTHEGDGAGHAEDAHEQIEALGQGGHVEPTSN